MKKRICIFLVLLIILIQTNSMFGQQVTPSADAELSNGTGQEVELLGRIDVSTIISAVIPTQVKFVVTPETTGWNKVLSPDFKVRNVGNVMLNVSVTKARVNTLNVEFTSEAPTVNNGVRQVRLAVAPKATYSDAVGVRDYFLTNSVDDSNYISLTEELDYAQNDTATYNIYGDISSGWTDSEEFSVSAVFKVEMAPIVITDETSTALSENSESASESESASMSLSESESASESIASSASESASESIASSASESVSESMASSASEATSSSMSLSVSEARSLSEEDFWWSSLSEDDFWWSSYSESELWWLSYSESELWWLSFSESEFWRSVSSSESEFYWSVSSSESASW